MNIKYVVLYKFVVKCKKNLQELAADQLEDLEN